jgi:hypothetical protein
VLWLEIKLFDIGDKSTCYNRSVIPEAPFTNPRYLQASKTWFAMSSGIRSMASKHCMSVWRTSFSSFSACSPSFICFSSPFSIHSSICLSGTGNSCFTPDMPKAYLKLMLLVGGRAGCDVELRRERLSAYRDLEVVEFEDCVAKEPESGLAVKRVVAGLAYRIHTRFLFDAMQRMHLRGSIASRMRSASISPRNSACDIVGNRSRRFGFSGMASSNGWEDGSR